MKQNSHIKLFIFFLFFLFSTSITYTQECIETAPIDGTPGAGDTPAGWGLWMSSPDLIAGLGPWPGGGYFVYDVDGISTSGGEMQLILANEGTIGEGIETTLTGLTLGDVYSVSIEWQQATLNNDDPGSPIIYAEGKLAMTLDGIETVFTSVGAVDDIWQVATATFTAAGPTALLQCSLKATDIPTTDYGYAIVIDDYLCSTELEVTLASSSICIGECVDLEANTTGGIGVITYEWSPGILETDDEVNVCPIVTTEYQVIATDGAGNTDTTTAIVTVNPKPVVDLGVDMTISLCPGVTFFLDAGNPGATYLWQDGSTDQTFEVTSADNYSVIVTSAAGCEETDDINILIADPLVLVIVPVEPSCFGYTDGSLTVNVMGGLGDLIISIKDEDDNVRNIANSNIAASLGAGWYSFTVTDEAGCSATALVFLDQPDPLIADFSFSPSAPRINEEVAFTDLTIDATAWTWDFGDGGNSNSDNPRHTYTSPDTYEITLNVSAGICSAMATATITIENNPIFFVPNGFTPDGDNFNQIFQPVFTSGFDPYDYHLIIFSRWGEVVFESFNAAYGWDGNYGDSGSVKDGVYIWEIEFGDSKTDEKHKHFGHVTILK